MRRVDPQGKVAEGVWTNVVLPVIDSIPELAADYDFKTATGRQIPRIWDPNALYDWRGRKIEKARAA
jgi:hypothetical protein